MESGRRPPHPEAKATPRQTSCREGVTRCPAALLAFNPDVSEHSENDSFRRKLNLLNVCQQWNTISLELEMITFIHWIGLTTRCTRVE